MLSLAEILKRQAEQYKANNSLAAKPDSQLVRQSEKQTEEQKKLTESITKLNDTIKKDLPKTLKESIEGQIKKAIKAGYGEQSGEDVKKGAEESRSKQRSFTRNILFGGMNSEELKKDSWFQKAADFTGVDALAKFSPSGFISKKLEKKEAEVVREKEKKEFVKNALVNDKNAIAVSNLKGGMKTEEGKDAATKYAEKIFEQMKAKEAELLKLQKTIDDARGAGYDPKKKDVEARDKAAGELAQIDPRQRQKFANKEFEERAEARENKSSKETKKSASKGEDVVKKVTKKSSAKEEDESLGSKLEQAEDQELEDQETIKQFKNIGDTLKQSLAVQQEMLKALLAGGAGGGNKEEKSEEEDDGGGGFNPKNLWNGAKNILSKGKGIRSALSGGVGSKLVKGAAVLAAGQAVYSGVNKLAQGKNTETLGDAVPEGWNKLNPYAWAMGGGTYVGDKINKGYGAISKAVGGSGSLGSDLYDGVDKIKGLFGASDKQKQEKAEKGAAQRLYDQRVKSNSLTEASAKFFESQGIKVDRSKIVAKNEKELAAKKGETPKQEDKKPEAAKEPNKEGEKSKYGNTISEAGKQSVVWDKEKKQWVNESEAKASTSNRSTGNTLNNSSMNNQALKDNKGTQSSSNIISAPTVVNNSNSTHPYRSEVRNTESTASRYVTSLLAR